jgi:hypothetical protein
MADLTSVIAEMATNDGDGGPVDDGGSFYDAVGGYYVGSDDW